MVSFTNQLETYTAKEKDLLVRNMSTVLNNVHEEHQHHENGSVTIFYHVEGPDKFNNFMFTSNFTFS